MNKKRGREEEADEEVLEALRMLQSTTIERVVDHKLRALDKVISLVDPSDESYTAQRALVDGDAAFYITELLADPSTAPRAAEAVAALCGHSAPARARLAGGPLPGLDSAVERVSLNPVQADFVDSGAVAALVPMLLQRQEALREAAGEAVAALCSYHQDGKLAQLEALVQALQAQPDLSTQVFELLDALLAGMDCSGDEAAQQIELVHAPLLAELRSRGRPQSGAVALTLLATLCERRPASAADLRQDGGVASTAQHLLQGSQVLQDAAARALWLLAKGDKKCLGPDAGLLGCEPLHLAKALAGLIEVAEAEEARVQQDLDAGFDSGRSDSGSEGGGGGLPPATPTAADICHAEEASLLLKALAAAYPEVQTLVDARDVPLGRHSSSACCIS